MYILGIAGRGHDASVCLVKDGELLRAMALERFCRLKRAVGPSHIIHKAALDAMHHCLASEGIGWDDLEYIVAVSPDTRLRPVPPARWRRTRSNASEDSRSATSSRTKGRIMQLPVYLVLFRSCSVSCSSERPAMD